MSTRMETSIDSNSSAQSNNAYCEVYEDFKRQAIDFYGTEEVQNLLSNDVVKCLKKKANAFVNREQKKLFLFPCMNDLSNIEDDEEPSIPQKCLDSLMGSKFRINLSRRSSSDFDQPQSSEIKDFSTIMHKQSLYKKNQDQN